MPTGRSLLARDVRFTRDDAEFDRAIGFVDATYALALTLLRAFWLILLVVEPVAHRMVSASVARAQSPAA